MKYEIERKFLVHRELLPKLPSPQLIWQGYLHDDSPIVRIRMERSPGEPVSLSDCTLTIKGKGSIKRPEISESIEYENAKNLKALCKTQLSKKRYKIGRWELDYFPSQDFYLAEIELKSVKEKFTKPKWIGAEVTEQKEFSNTRLVEGRLRPKYCVNCGRSAYEGCSKKCPEERLV